MSLKKKKSPTETMMENLPKPSNKPDQTQPPAKNNSSSSLSTSTPATPIQRVNLNQAATNAILKQDSSAPNAPVPNQRAGTATRKLGKDSYKLEFPDGTAFTGTMQEVSDMRNKYNLANPVEDSRLTAMREADKIQAQYNAELAATNPANVLPDELDMIGQPQPIQQDMLTYDIYKTKAEKANEPPQILGKLTRLLPGGKYTDTAVNLLSDSPDMKKYFSEFSQAENYAKVQDNIDLAFGSIEISKERALQYGDRESIRIYNKGQGELRKAYTDLYIMTQSEPEKFTPEVINQMAELRQYFDEKQDNDDLELRNTLQNFNLNKAR